MPPFQFANRERCDGVGVYFEASILNSETAIACRITREALCDRLGAGSPTSQDLIDAFRHNRHRIEQIAEALIDSARYEADGSILIKRGNVK